LPYNEIKFDFPQTTEIDALVYMWVGKILRHLAHTALYRKRQKIGIYGDYGRLTGSHNGLSNGDVADDDL